MRSLGAGLLNELTDEMIEALRALRDADLPERDIAKQPR